MEQSVDERLPVRGAGVESRYYFDQLAVLCCRRATIAHRQKNESSGSLLTSTAA